MCYSQWRAGPALLLSWRQARWQGDKYLSLTHATTWLMRGSALLLSYPLGWLTCAPSQEGLPVVCRWGALPILPLSWPQGQLFTTTGGKGRGSSSLPHPLHHIAEEGWGQSTHTLSGVARRITCRPVNINSTVWQMFLILAFGREGRRQVNFFEFEIILV